MRPIDADALENRVEDFEELTGMKLDIVHDFISSQPLVDVVETDKVNKIYKELADRFSIPCNFCPCDEIMLESERCKDDCGDVSAAECWRRYFEVVCNGEMAET